MWAWPGLSVIGPSLASQRERGPDPVENEEPPEPVPEPETPEIDPAPMAPFTPPPEEQAPESGPFIAAATLSRPTTEMEALEEARLELLVPELEVPNTAKQLLSSQRMMEALDRVREEMTEDAESQAFDTKLTTSVVESAALATSFSLLAILSRAGSLAASVLSALPMWRHVDPHAVLLISYEARQRRERGQRAPPKAAHRDRRSVAQP